MWCGLWRETHRHISSARTPALPAAASAQRPPAEAGKGAPSLTSPAHLGRCLKLHRTQSFLRDEKTNPSKRSTHPSGATVSCCQSSTPSGEAVDQFWNATPGRGLAPRLFSQVRETEAQSRGAGLTSRQQSGGRGKSRRRCKGRSAHRCVRKGPGPQRSKASSRWHWAGCRSCTNSSPEPVGDSPTPLPTLPHPSAARAFRVSGFILKFIQMQHFTPEYILVCSYFYFLRGRGEETEGERETYRSVASRLWP